MFMMNLDHLHTHTLVPLVILKLFWKTCVYFRVGWDRRGDAVSFLLLA